MTPRTDDPRATPSSSTGFPPPSSAQELPCPDARNSYSPSMEVARDMIPQQRCSNSLRREWEDGSTVCTPAHSKASTNVISNPSTLEEKRNSEELSLRARNHGFGDRDAFRQRVEWSLDQHNQAIRAQLHHELLVRLHGTPTSSGRDAPRAQDYVEINNELSPWILLSGPPGCGKTRLVHALRGIVETELGGYFAVGHFSARVGGAAPYPALVEALDDLAQQVLRRGLKEVARVRAAFQGAVDVEASFLVRLVPRLQEILGLGGDSPSTVPTTSSSGALSLSSSGSMLHFLDVFGDVFRALGSPEAPLVLILDDLHYADSGSIKVLTEGILPTISPGLIVITCLDLDKVPSPSPLTDKLLELDDFQRPRVSHLRVINLNEDAVDHVLSQLLKVDHDNCCMLGGLIHRRTLGNPYFISELLVWLFEAELLPLDPDLERWAWEAAEVDLCFDSVASLEALLSQRLAGLSRECQDLLKVASCLGPTLDVALLACILGETFEASLQEALVQGGLIRLLEEDRSGGSNHRYRFECGLVQAMSYGLIPKEEASQFHLQIARTLWRRLDEAGVDQHLFTLANQLRLGQALIHRPKERAAVAKLFLHSAVKSARFSSFSVACEYLDYGIELLGEKGWRENYELSLALHNAAAELAVCSNTEKLDAYLNAIFSNTRDYRDSVQAHGTKIYYYGMCERQQEAIHEGMNVLKRLGIKFPSKATKAGLVLELFVVRMLLKGKTDNQLLRMATITNTEKRMSLQILSLMFQISLFSRPDLAPFLVLKMMKITLNYGMSEFASLAFVNYGMLCLAVYGHASMGCRFGSLGLALLDRFKAKEFLPRTYATYYGQLSVYKAPLKDCLPPLVKAYHIGLQTGDIEAAHLCAIVYCMNAVETGMPLPVVEREHAKIQSRMEASRQKSMAQVSLPLIQCLHDLMGVSNDPLSPRGDVVDYDALYEESMKGGRRIVAAAVLVCRLTVAYILNEYELAAKMMGCLDHIDVIPPGAPKLGLLMTIGMCSIELTRMGRDRARNIRIAKSVIRRLRSHASQQPVNCIDKLFLLEAEWASYRNKPSAAEQKYMAAIALADAAGFRYVSAKGSESFARHLLRLERRPGAAHQPPSSRCRQTSRPHFDKACRVYQEWGALVKYQRLQSEVAALFGGTDEESLMATARTIPTNGNGT